MSPRLHHALRDLTFEGKATFQEGHFAAYIGAKLENVTPYVGLRYSGVRTKLKPEERFSGDFSTTKFKADDRIGLFGGLSYALTRVLKLNLEGRFIDETAVTIRLAYRF